MAGLEVIAEGLFTDKTCFIATGTDLKYILANLNSTIGRYQCSKEVAILDNGGYLMQKIYLEKIRIAPANEDQKKSIVVLVDKILDAKKKDSDADTSALESQIDELVYDLYGLTREEREIVERKSKARVEGEGGAGGPRGARALPANGGRGERPARPQSVSNENAMDGDCGHAGRVTLPCGGRGATALPNGANGGRAQSAKKVKTPVFEEEF